LGVVPITNLMLRDTDPSKVTGTGPAGKLAEIPPVKPISTPY